VTTPSTPGPALHQLLVEACRDAPASIAVVEIGEDDEPSHRTYGELRHEAERLAAALTSCGVGRGDRVVVDAVTSAATIAMIMACSEVGAAFVPLTPEIPDARARQIVRLAEPHCYAHLDGCGRFDRLTDRDDPAVMAFSWNRDPVPERRRSRSAGRRSAGGGDPLAYIIFTSGSTGTPKGVAMSQRATSAFFDATRGLLRPTDRVVSTAPFHFDFCLLDIGTCLANRCAVVPMPRERIRWPRQFVAVLRATGGTRVHAVPSIWRPLLHRERHLLAHLPPLNAIMYSGEPFPPDDLAVLHRTLPDTRLVNCYGPTECMACSFTDVTEFADGSTATPIDGAYPGSSLAIADDDGMLIDEPGRSGQLRFTGPSIFEGYWAAGGAVPPETVRRAAGGPATLLTGDYGHLGQDGRLYFDGRRDRQVKLGGNRVELAEIEVVLRQVPDVDDARVVVDTREEPPVLLAFVAAPVDDGDHCADVCRQICAEKLPEYMRPAAVFCLPYLPTNSNDKVDRQLLLRHATQHDRT